MDQRRDLAVLLSEFAQHVGPGSTVSEILHRLGDYCVEILQVDGAGVLLADGDGTLRFATASDELGRRIEELEAAIGEGPCIDCFRTGVQVDVPDLRGELRRYPRFAPAALEAGIHGVYALPMSLREQRLGTLDLVAGRPLRLTGSELAAAQLLADVAVSYVVNSRAFEERSRLADQLQAALDSRVVIEQAKGILAERMGTDVTQAFHLIRGYARTNSRKLRDVADEIIDGSLRLD